MKIIYNKYGHRVYKGHILDVIKEIPDESINIVITSPPFFNMRSYPESETIWGGDKSCNHKWSKKKKFKGNVPNHGIGSKSMEVMKVTKESHKEKWYSGSFCEVCGGFKGQLGLEPYPELYVDHLVEIFDEIKRILKKDGTVWLNLGDTYAGSGHGYGRKIEGKQATNKGTDFMSKIPPNPLPEGLKPKDLIGIPWRVAFALQKRGWWLRQDIIWSKNNSSMPESVGDRCTRSHEYIFLLTKSKNYYYDNKSIKEKSIDKESYKGMNPRYIGNLYYEDKERYQFSINKNGESTITGKKYPFRNKRSVWTVNPKSFPETHFAVFPRELIIPCIKAGCPKGGIVFDPFLGSGTTLIVADKLERKCIGVEISKKYCDIILKMIDKEIQPKLF